MNLLLKTPEDFEKLKNTYFGSTSISINNWTIIIEESGYSEFTFNIIFMNNGELIHKEYTLNSWHLNLNGIVTEINKINTELKDFSKSQVFNKDIKEILT